MPLDLKALRSKYDDTTIVENFGAQLGVDVGKLRSKGHSDTVIAENLAAQYDSLTASKTEPKAEPVQGGAGPAVKPVSLEDTFTTQQVLNPATDAPDAENWQILKDQGFAAASADARGGMKARKTEGKAKFDKANAAAKKGEGYTERDRGEVVSDAAIAGKQGLLNVMGGASWLVDKLPGIDTDGFTSAMLEGAQAEEKNKSAETQASNRRVQRAEGAAETIDALLDDPMSIADMVFQSAPIVLPGMAAGALTARVAARSAASRALAAGASKEAALKAAQAAAVAGASIGGKSGEAVISGGMSGAQTEADIKGMPIDQLEEVSARFRALSLQMTPEEAREQLAAEVSLATAAATGGATALGGWAAGRVNKLAKLGDTYSDALLKRVTAMQVGKNVAGEVVEEGIQSPGEKIAGNLTNVDDNKGAFDDVDKAAVMGVAGAIGQSGATQAGGALLRSGGAMPEAPESPAAGGLTPAPAAPSPQAGPVPSAESMQAAADDAARKSQEFAALADEARGMGNAELASQYEAESVAAAAEAKQALDTITVEHTGLQGVANRTGINPAAVGLSAQESYDAARQAAFNEAMGGAPEAEQRGIGSLPLSAEELTSGRLDAGNRAALGLDGLQDNEELQPVANSGDGTLAVNVPNEAQPVGAAVASPFYIKHPQTGEDVPVNSIEDADSKFKALIASTGADFEGGMDVFDATTNQPVANLKTSGKPTKVETADESRARSAEAIGKMATVERVDAKPAGKDATQGSGGKKGEEILSVKGKYSDGSEFATTYHAIKKTDGSYMLARTVTDDQGSSDQYYNMDGLWETGTPSSVSINMNAGGQVGGPEIFPSKEYALNSARDDAGVKEDAKPTSEQEMRKRMAYLRGAIAASGDDKFKTSAKKELRELTNKINSLKNADPATVSPETVKAPVATAEASPDAAAMVAPAAGPGAERVSALAEDNADTSQAQPLAQADEQAKDEPKAAAAPKTESSPTGLNYPNRKLGLEFAKTEDGGDPNAWANIALANLQPDDKVTVNGVTMTVKSIGAKAVTFTKPDGKTTRFDVDTPRMEQLVRDVAGLLEASHHSSHGRDWVSVLSRDPTFGRTAGVINLQDRGTEATASVDAMNLAARHARLDRAIDQLSDTEVHALYRKMGLAGELLNVDKKREALKQEHPDDIEAAMKAKPEAAKPEVNADPRTEDSRQSKDAPVSQVVLQNRNRSDAAYVQQMTQISANPDATRLGFSRDFSAGAPVILADGIPSSQMGRVDRAATGAGRQIEVQYAVVEAADLLASNAADGTKVPGYDTGIAGKSRAVAGNGRVAGLKSAYQKGTAGKYREDIAGDEALHGVSASVIRGMKAPILVRIMSPADVTANIGDESNDSGVSQKSAIEHAKDDARRIDVAGLEFGEDGEVTKATMRQFVASMPVSEQTGMLTAGGEPTTQATNRLMGAIFWQAYQSEGLTELFSQATDPEARTVLQGLAIAAPAMARLKDIAGHDLDIRDLITEAAVATVNARRRNIKLSEYVNQLDLDASPEIAPILRMFAENIRSSKKIGESLQGAAEYAYDEATRDTSGGMFGDAVPAATRNQVLEKIHDSARQENLGQQGRPVADGGDAQGQAANTRAEGDRAEAEGNQQERLSAQKTEWLTSLAQTLLRNGRTTERDFVSDDGQEYTVKATESTGRLTTAQYDGWKRAVGLANSAMPVNEELLNVSITLTGRNVGEGRDYRAIRTEYVPKADQAQARESLIARYRQAAPMSAEWSELLDKITDMTISEAKRDIDAGTPVAFSTGNGTFVTITPSAQQQGMIQVTMYNQRGIFGDSQYADMESAVRDHNLRTASRISGAELDAALGESLNSERQYQAARQQATLAQQNEARGRVIIARMRAIAEANDDRSDRADRLIDDINDKLVTMDEAEARATAIESDSDNGSSSRLFDRWVSLAADSIERLRASDVGRVLEQAQSPDSLKAAAEYLSRKRPDLRGVIERDAGAIAEENGWVQSADDFSLSTQTEEDLREKEDRERDEEAAAAAEQARQAEASSESFQLSTGIATTSEQVRPAVRGQGLGLFDQRPTTRGEAAQDLAASPAAEPSEVDDKDNFSVKRLNDDRTEFFTTTFSRDEYVKALISSKDSREGERFVTGRINGISHARREAKVNEVWFGFGSIYKTDQPSDVKPDTVPLSSVIDAVNARHGAGLTDADRVPDYSSILSAEADLWSRITDGTATVDEFKAGFERWVNGKEEIKSVLSKQTKKELLEMAGGMLAYRLKNEAKPAIVEAVWRDGMAAYALGSSITYGMGRDSYTNAVRLLVEGTDADALKQFADERKAAAEEAVAERAAAVEAIKEPKTLDDFIMWMRARMSSTGESFTEARMALTPDQRATFDKLSAESTREAREARKRALKTTVRTAGQSVTGEIIATKHTRDNYDLFVVQLAERLSADDYRTVLESAKKLGGWYSAYRGNGATPGFQFKEKASAEAFLKLAAGDSADAQAQAEQRRDIFNDDRSQSAVERLTEMADRLDQRADESLSAERKQNTARRARFAASAEAAANADKALAKTMRNIATAISEGKAELLDAVRQKAQVEMLTGMVRTAKDKEIRAKFPAYADQEKQRGSKPTSETADFAEFPSFTSYRSDLASLARQLLEVDGTKKIGQRLLKVADDVSDAYLEFAKANLSNVATFSIAGGTAALPSKDAAEKAISRSGLAGKAIVLPVKRGENLIILSPSEAINRGIWTGDGDKRITLSRDFGNELVQTIGRRANKSNRLTVPWQFETAADRLKALAGMGIETPAELRTALREFIALQEQPAAPNKIKEMERAMIGRRNDGLDFFPTPQEVADQMIEAAGIEPGMSVLEPSAGMGHIAERIQAAGVDPDVVELSSERRELLEAKGFRLVGNDFLSIKPREFFTFGDTFRAQDGTEGVMRGLGGMGSNRVRLEEEGGRVTYHDRDDLTGVRKNGSESGYDRIIMNPPFGDRRDAEHVRHAYSLLKPGGRLVAIMGEGVFFGSDKKAQEFRDWLEQAGGTDEKLAENTFMDPSLPVNTGVSARMVVIDKPTSGDMLYSRSGSAWYYSPLTRAVEGIRQETALASQWRAMIEKAPGVKSDELEATGVIEWLQAAGGKVKKSDILDFLSGNSVTVQDVEKGHVKTYPEGMYMHPVTGDVQSRQEWIDDLDPDELMNEGITEEEALSRLEDVSGHPIDDDFSTVKYDKYVVPGGKNYRELLITRPEGVQPKDMPAPLTELPEEYENNFDSSQPDGKQWSVIHSSQMHGRPYGGFRAASPQEARAGALQILNSERDNAARDNVRSKTYYSSHWDEKNILAHVRFDERTDADGKRVLFIHEIQSDWGQDGKKKGFAPKDPSAPTDDEVREFFDLRDGANPADYRDEMVELLAGRRVPDGRPIPRAPFVTKTDAWVSLAIKRMIRYAAENGFDRVAFINGQQAADLYDLSKQVDQLLHHKNSDGTYQLSAITGSRGNMLGEAIPESKLEDYVGKDVAEKIIKGEGKRTQVQGDPGYMMSLSGLDLKVGDEGMRTFYDKIVPKVAGDVIKKLGGGKLRPVQVSTGSDAGSPKWTVQFEDGSQHNSSWTDRRVAEQIANPKYGDKVVQVGTTGSEQLGFDITPAMRDAALAGLPLFAKNKGKSVNTKASVESVIAPVVAQWKSGPNINVVQSVTDLPGGSAPHDVEGAYAGNGVVYLVADNLPTRERVKEVLAHEAVGHAAMEAMLGPDLMAELTREIGAWERRGSAFFVKLGKDVDASQPGLPADRRAKEIVALMAERGLHKTGSLWQRVTGAIRAWLRSIGFNGRWLNRLTEGDMFKMLADAERYLTDGPSGPGTGRKNAEAALAYSRADTLFSRSSPSVVGDTYKLPPVRSFITKIFDRFDRIKQVQKAVKEQGGQIDLLSDVYGQEEAYHSRAASAIDRFRRHRMGAIFKRMARAGVSLEDVGLYLYAQHASERNAQIATINPGMPDGGSGMTNAEARTIMADFRQKGNANKLDTFARELREITADTRQILRNSGLESNDAIDAWEQAYQFYVPLSGKDEANNASNVIVGRGFDVRGGQKRAMGRKDKAKHIIEQIIIQHEQAVIRAEKNAVAKRLLQFVKSNPDGKLWEVNPTEQRRYISADGQVEYRNQPLRTDRNVVSVRINGKDTFVLLADQGMADAIHNVGTEDVGFVLRALGEVSRFISKMFTAFSPAFIAVNALRDFQTAMLHGYQVGGIDYSRRIAKNMPKAIAELVRDVRTGDSKLVKLYEQSGGRTGMVFMIKDFEEKHDEVMKQMAALQGVSLKEIQQAFAVGAKEGFKAVGRKARYNRFTGVFDAFVEVVETINGVVENATRLAAFKAAMDSGRSAKEAGSIAKNLTVNFNRKGELASHLGSLYIFFNASVQGTARMAEALKDRRLQVVAAGLFMASFLLAALQMDDDDDEDGRADFEQVPVWQRSRSLVISAGDGEYIKIPLPLGWNVFHMLGTEAAIMLKSKSREAYGAGAKNMLTQTIGAFNPVGDLTPSVAAPFLQIARNESAFGGPIYPDYKDQLPDSQQFYDGTEGSVYQRATALANQATGGNEFRPGLIDVNPEKLEHVVEFFGGGALRFLTDTVDAVSFATDGGPSQPADKLPIVRAFYGKLRDEYQTSRYYENKDKVEAAAFELKGLEDSGRMEEAAALLDEKPWVYGLSAMAEDMEKKKKFIKELERQIRADDSLTDGERRAQLQEIRVLRGQLVKPFNAAYEEAMAK